VYGFAQQCECKLAITDAIGQKEQGKPPNGPEDGYVRRGGGRAEQIRRKHIYQCGGAG
jgi:hypothetical protein